ncbi:MAG: hypothetical protein RLZZ399_2547 [Verrucomicrobiota bacterium]|jgi:hypothetical protein
MSRLGCSGRECHGSFQGRGGFQLSLFGYDFDRDFEQITKDDKGDEGGTRINAEDPTRSLILLKGAAIRKHKGKERFAKDSWEYNLLLKWVASGAKLDVAETGEFARLEVFPKEIQFRKPTDTTQLKVLAYWKDGTVEDVTAFTRFRSNDDAVAVVSESGQVASKGPGDTQIVAFYDNGVTPIPVMLPVSDLAKYPKPTTPARNRVDELINAKLSKVGIIPSPLCSDTEFLRRASLDVTGTLPTPREIEKFLADPAPDKRDRKIEELLARPGYAAWWATRLCDFTGNNPVVLRGNGLIAGAGQNNFGPILARQWFDWLYTRIEQNRPYDELAAGIIVASTRTRPDQSFEEFATEMSGYFRKENPISFGERATMPWFWARQNVAKAEDKALAFAHTFLGVRIECAQCHKHPFDQWTKQDFAQFQAFFTPIGFQATGAPLAMSAKMKAPASPAVASAGEAADGPSVKSIRAEISAQARANVDRVFLERDLKKAAELRESASKQVAEVLARIAPAQAVAQSGSGADLPVNASAVADSGTGGAAAPGASGAPGAANLKPAVSADEPLQPLPMTEAEKVRREADLRVAYQREEERLVRERMANGQLLPWADLNARASKGAKAAAAPKAAVAGGSRVITPKLLGGGSVLLESYEDVRLPLMEWLRSPENPYFAKAWVNRVWAAYFGRGIVDPADDLNLANAPSNAELFEYLASAFVANGFDMKWLHREILRSDAYQRSWKTNETNKLDEKNFSRALIRRLPAELVHDAIQMATETRENLEAYPINVEGRAIGAASTTAFSPKKVTRNADPYALTIFGKPVRQTNCDCERIMDPTLLQTLYTRNDPSMLARIDNKRGTGWIEESLGLVGSAASAAAAAVAPERVDGLIREMYFRTVSRPPTPEEVGKARADVLAHPSVVQGAREVLWALMNTREFLVNH